VEIPETGIPEGVARGIAAREDIAKNLTGKPLEELSPSERLVIDDLIAEGYVGAPAAPAPGRASLSDVAGPALAPAQKPKPIRNRSGERGSFSFKPTTPQTPAEIYAAELTAKREAARQGPIGTTMERIKQAVAKAKSEVVDSTAPILDAIRQHQPKPSSKTVSPEQRMNYQIDRVYRANSLAEQFMKDNGLIDVIKEVDNIDYFDQYLIAKHAQRVPADIPTGRDYARDAILLKEFEPRYEVYAQKVKQYSEKLLDYITDSGLISQELSAKLKQQYPDYVPLKRVFSEIEKTGGFETKRGVASLSEQTVVKKLKGSEREIESPLASFIDKTAAAFAEGERNRAAKLLADTAQFMPGLIEEVPAGKHVDSRRTFSVRDNGVKRTFKTTPEIAAAAKSLDTHSIGLIGQILAIPGRVLKIGTTGINLPFIASNIFSDAITTAVTRKYGNTLANPLAFSKAFLNAVRHGDLWDELVRGGGGYTSFEQMRNNPRLTAEKIRAGRSAEARLEYAVEHPIRTIGDLFRAAEDFVSKAEQFGRIRLYETAKQHLLKQGYSTEDAHILAINEANNSLPNYMRAGDIMRPLNAAIPYLNAGIQGSRVFLRSMAENSARTSARVAITLFFPAAMATVWNLSDPDRKKAYEDIAPYEKENNLIILGAHPTKDSQGRWDVYKIKLPPGMGRLATPVRQILEQANGLNPVRFSEIAKALFGSVAPFEPTASSLLSTVTPQALKPTLQAAANYDYFRERPKVPRRLQGLPSNMQAQPYTSGTARVLGEKLGTSPIKTEEFIKDTLGGIGSQVLHYSDRALARAGVIPTSQIGGTGTLEAVSARLSKARGDELESREYKAREDIREQLIKRAVDQAKNMPIYKRLGPDAQQKYLERAAARASYLVTSATSKPAYKRATPERRMEMLENLRNRYSKLVPARIARINQESISTR
jgi:hypothetical protein